MKCTYCTRAAVHQLGTLHLCDECGNAFREGFEKGKVFESIRRRNQFKKR